MAVEPARAPVSVHPVLRATYRLQLHPGFGFDHAAAVLDYLSELGVSHAYVSPCLTAVRGSTHGYDVVDPTRVNDELGGHRARDAFASSLRDRGMAQIVDIVPNHMAASAEQNPWWRDVLERGIESRYARHFDIDWDASEARKLRYRRFFDVDSLVALNVHEDEVFRDVHVVISRWLEEGAVAGVRVDHIDGIRDPAAYLERLHAAAPSAYVVVEKILTGDETLPDTFRAAGTTGYDFLNRLEGIFVDPAGEEPLTAFHARFTGAGAPFADVARDAKHLVMRTSLEPDVGRIVRCLARECEGTRWFDVPEPALRGVVAEYLAELPVYRTYVRPGGGAGGAREAAVVRNTIARVARRLPGADPAFLDFVAARLAGEDGTGELASLMQQTSGAVMAKGVEDTAFYRYTRFIALNEVGGDPSVFGCSVERFHAHNAAVFGKWPETLVTTATHDTKRGEDVRARLAVLSEIPAEWARRVERWHELARAHLDPRVDPNDEYAFYQTLAGAFPLSEERALAYMQKAIREAKRQTSWSDPDAAYEAAIARFVKGMLGDRGCMQDVGEFVSRIVTPGRVVSLAKKLIALTAPGVPDVYQGTELWDLSLVDPDNRRPVDYDERRRLLATCKTLSAEEIWSAADSGLPKMRVVQAALSVRRRRARAFGRGGSYTPLEVAGPRLSNVVAYARGEDVVVIVPRLVATLPTLGGGFGETAVRLPEGRFTNEFTGATVEGVALVDPLLEPFPVALLTRAS